MALEQVAAVNVEVGGLEQAQATKDWWAMQEHAEQASSALDRLLSGPGIVSLKGGNDPASVEELRSHAQAASDALREAQQSIREKKGERLEAALQTFRKAFGPVREAAKRPVG